MKADGSVFHRVALFHASVELILIKKLMHFSAMSAGSDIRFPSDTIYLIPARRFICSFLDNPRYCALSFPDRVELIRRAGRRVLPLTTFEVRHGRVINFYRNSVDIMTHQ